VKCFYKKSVKALDYGNLDCIDDKSQVPNSIKFGVYLIWPWSRPTFVAHVTKIMAFEHQLATIRNRASM